MIDGEDGQTQKHEMIHITSDYRSISTMERSRLAERENRRCRGAGEGGLAHDDEGKKCQEGHFHKNRIISAE
jgi:hypothetical protein